MAGLSLSVGGYGGGPGGYSGGWGGAAVPVSSNSPSSTIGQMAYGISTQGDGGPRTAGFGTVGLGLAGALVLTWLWYTLPR